MERKRDSEVGVLKGLGVVGESGEVGVLKGVRPGLEVLVLTLRGVGLDVELFRGVVPLEGEAGDVMIVRISECSVG